MLDAMDQATGFLGGLSPLTWSYAVFFLAALLCLICFRHHHWQLAAMQKQIYKLKRAVRELEAAENRRFVLSLKSRANDETPLAGPAPEAIDLNGDAAGFRFLVGPEGSAVREPLGTSLDPFNARAGCSSPSGS
jgi:hypothetical protein